jgi:NAD(P)-dependent dehydrogenase (short-subunit alcohol dehydrogenase family)
LARGHVVAGCGGDEVSGYLVTGGASGLGAALTTRLRARGQHVVTLDLAGADVVADLGTAAGRAEGLAAALDLVDGTLSGLVPCAGLGPQVPDHPLIASVNFFGAVAFLDGCLDALAVGTSPAAVAISSNSTTIDPTVNADLVAAFLARDEASARGMAADLPGNSVYASSKVAIARDVRRRVDEWGGRGVRINAVAPGPFHSPLLQQGLDDPTFGPLIESLPVPTGAIGTPAQVAAVIDFLLGADAAYVHGSIVFADGGIDALLRPDAI